MITLTPATIAGTVVKELKLIRNAKGRVMEIQRNDDACFPGFGQVHFTCTLPGVVRAWFMHRDQIDQIAVVSGQVRLVLYDGRGNSPTLGTVNEYVISGDEPRLVQFPQGIWHGFAAVGDREAWVVHLNTEPFDYENPDEMRLPQDDASIPYVW